MDDELDVYIYVCVCVYEYIYADRTRALGPPLGLALTLYPSVDPAGAFTPTCSMKHLPSFIETAAEIKGKGVDTICCLSVNDFFVMKKWMEGTEGATDSGILFLADGGAVLTQVSERVDGWGERDVQLVARRKDVAWTECAVVNSMTIAGSRPRNGPV